MSESTDPESTLSADEWGAPWGAPGGVIRRWIQQRWNRNQNHQNGTSPEDSNSK